MGRGRSDDTAKIKAASSDGTHSFRSPRKGDALSSGLYAAAKVPYVCPDMKR